MKLVYLHGVGDGDVDRGWLAGLNEGLEAQKLSPISDDDIIAPLYADILLSPDAEAPIPKPTAQGAKADVSAERAEFLNRQIEAARAVGADPSVQSLGFPLLDVEPPEWALGKLKGALPEKLFANEIGQIKAYAYQKGIRGAVLQRVLSQLPAEGEVVIVGHSLGSVVTVDLISRLPRNIDVRRVVTIGSPANTALFTTSRRELIGNFPYGSTDSWLNFFSPRDPVTRARGLAGVFADVQDFRVDIGGAGHRSKVYLRNTAVARAVGTAFHSSPLTPPRTSRVTTSLNDDLAALILELHFRYAVRDAITDKKVQPRYAEAARIKRAELVAEIWEADSNGIPLPREFHQLAEGKTPGIPNYWTVKGLIEQLTILALSDLIAPFEIDIEDAAFKALPSIASKSGLPPGFGGELESVVRAFNATITKMTKPGANWGRIAFAAAGVAVIAIAPYSLFALAPTGAAGAAALSGGLAALGPGGMAGGIAAIGGIAGTGAAITTAAAVGGRVDGARLNSGQLLLATAVAYAQHKFGHDYDEDIWRKATAVSAELSAQVNTVEPISDPKSRSLTALIAERDLARNLVTFLESNGLVPADAQQIDLENDQR
ncbi:hypothetical protein [uncultured Williamsia sp.]|uniref:hypothetical protein n=1 Tax=uncultured Williamsia sp. TaxID=259311 RepID=UPI00262220EA|nr:hypothetical protein [uncultured Williamsia sp.]